MERGLSVFIRAWSCIGILFLILILAEPWTSDYFYPHDPIFDTPFTELYRPLVKTFPLWFFIGVVPALYFRLKLRSNRLDREWKDKD